MLTDAECKNFTCPPGKNRARLACSGGLYLEASPTGSKRWFWKYRKDGKEGRMALGSYPDVGAKAARKARDEAKAQKANGTDPVQARKVAKLKESACIGQLSGNGPGVVREAQGALEQSLRHPGEAQP